MSPRMLTRRMFLAGTAAALAAGAGTVGWLNRGRLQDRVEELRPALELARGPSDRLLVRDRPSFWAGVNYPWKTGQDFGTGGWGHTGVSEPTTYQEIDIDFANMAAQGVRVVKWRVFSDGRYSPVFDPDGMVTGLGELFFADLDGALEIAARHDMYLVLTLFSSGFWTADCHTGDVQLGGHAVTLTDPDKRRSLIQQALVPFLQHISASDRVLAFEIIAEPEWGIQELHTEEDARIKVPHAVVRDFVADAVKAIHQHSRALTTVESNRFSNMQAWQGLHLDYYSFSWYDWLEPYEPLATPAASAGLDRPVVLGEYPAGGSAYYALPQVLDLTQTNGYAGAFAWSYWSGDGLSHWQVAAPNFLSWVRDRWDLVGLGAAVPAVELPPRLAYPYAFADLSTRVENDLVVADLKIEVPSGEPYVPHAYLYEIGNPQPLKDVRLTAAPGQPGLLEARFDGVAPAHPYAISLGIFDRNGALKKWFGNVSTFSLQNGALVPPQVDTLASELGCGA